MPFFNFKRLYMNRNLRIALIIGIFLIYNILAAMFTNNWHLPTGTVMFFIEAAAILAIAVFVIVRWAKSKK